MKGAQLHDEHLMGYDTADKHIVSGGIRVAFAQVQQH